MSDAVRHTVRDLLAARAPGATICPSEVARAIVAAANSADWRAAMPAVHDAVAAMAADGSVQISWRGAPRAVGDGPYRIGTA